MEFLVRPSFSPKQWIKKDFSYLSGISNDDILMGNESGIYIKGKTDKYGFNNPNSVYKKSIRIRINWRFFLFWDCLNYPRPLHYYLLIALTR